jgi:hypothetical protein
MVFGQAMKVGHGQCALAVRAAQMHVCAECRQRHTHVGRMSGDTCRRRTKNRVNAVEPVDRIAALARVALVAARTVNVVEVGAAGALQDVATDRRHVSNLGRSAGNEGSRKHRIARPHRMMRGDGGVAGRCADQEAAVFPLLDSVRKPRDVD